MLFRDRETIMIVHVFSEHHDSLCFRVIILTLLGVSFMLFCDIGRLSIT